MKSGIMMKLNNSWSYGTTEHTTSDGQSYSWYYKPRTRNSAARSELRVDARLPAEFSIVHEGIMHRFAKFLGFATEFQTTDLDFDDKFYIYCDDQQICQLLRNSAQRHAIKTISHAGGKTIEAKHGGITVLMKHAQPDPDRMAADSIVGALSTFKSAAAGITLAPSSPGKNFSSRATITTVIIIALLIIGIVGIIASPHTMPAYWPLFQQAMLYALLPAIVGLLLIQSMFQGSSRGVLVFTTYLFAGLPGVALCTYLALYSANIYYDTSERAYRNQRIIRTDTTHSSKSGTKYYVVTHDWTKGGGDELRLKVPYSVYQRAQRGGTIHFITRAGYLGFEWIEDFQVGQ